MATAEEWAALAARCEKAAGVDREIDLAIREAGEYPRKPWNYTASVDAILALIAEKLPGWCRYAEELRHGRWFGGLKPSEQAGSGYRGDLSAYAATPALALCSAFCRAQAATSSTEAKQPEGV